MQSIVKFGFGDQLVVCGLHQRRKSLALTKPALEIGAGFHRSRSGVSHVRSVMVAGVHVGNRGAVADDVSVKVPGIAQMIT